MKNILITGISGFIGRHVARKLISEQNNVTAIIRPGTEYSRVAEFKDTVKFIEVDLSDLSSLKEKLRNEKFDVLLHIGALRGGRKFSQQDFYRTNVSATEILLNHAKKVHASFVFCSSVGVYGAIPAELPANNYTEKNADTYYHLTKIKAEEILQSYVKDGLHGVIVRPAITYGVGDFGFPYTLIKLIDKKIFFMSEKSVTIHLTNIYSLTEVFSELCDGNFKSGNAYIIADRSPVLLTNLVNFISEQIKGKRYSRYRTLPHFIFDMAIMFSKMLQNELWRSRFELISKSWYYDTSNSFADLNFEPAETIPAFKIVTDWYKSEG